MIFFPDTNDSNVTKDIDLLKLLLSHLLYLNC
jgi:hypothetical protein